MSKVLLVNDKNILNKRYRSGLMRGFDFENIDYTSIGTFDTPFSFILKMSEAYSKSWIILSSNLKTNLIILLMYKLKKVIIFNGLGRYRKVRFFRKILLLLLKLNRKHTHIFQNYSDFRFFSRFSKTEISWVPGSGGTFRQSGKNDGFIVVTRSDKLKLVSSSIIEFALSSSPKPKFFIVGCPEDTTKKYLGSYKNFDAIGYVPQSDIFKSSNCFFQPSGYGEGVPHTLVDAIVSGLKVVVCKKDFVSFGLYKLGFKFIQCCGSWGYLDGCNNSKLTLCANTVNKEYIRLLKSRLN